MGSASFSRISSLHFRNDVRKNPVREVMAPSLPRGHQEREPPLHERRVEVVLGSGPGLLDVVLRLHTARSERRVHEHDVEPGPRQVDERQTRGRYPRRTAAARRPPSRGVQRSAAARPEVRPPHPSSPSRLPRPRGSPPARGAPPPAPQGRPRCGGAFRRLRPAPSSRIARGRRRPAEPPASRRTPQPPQRPRVAVRRPRCSFGARVRADSARHRAP